MARDAGDIGRTQAYREKSKREKFTKTNESLSSSNMFAGLNLKVEVRQASTNDLKRVTESISSIPLVCV